MTTAEQYLQVQGTVLAVNPTSILLRIDWVDGDDYRRDIEVWIPFQYCAISQTPRVGSYIDLDVTVWFLKNQRLMI